MSGFLDIHSIRSKGEEVTISVVRTVRGRLDAEDMGRTLIHEHLLCDFIGADGVDRDRYSRPRVVQEMVPYLKEVKELGFETFVDCTPAFIGRDPVLLSELAEKTDLNILTNTGLYKEPYLPRYAFAESASELAQRWIGEFNGGIEAGIKPGFIKIAVNPGPLFKIQQKIVRAAALTCKETGLTIASHTVKGVAAVEEIKILKENGVDPENFIFVHADGETELDLHDEVLAEGAWLEYDSVGGRELQWHIELLERARDEGYLDQILLSHDAGWYTVGEEGGGEVRPYSAISRKLHPALERKWGKEETEKIMDRLLVRNPREALGRKE